ncbi:hypothetical protein tpqmel_1078, partial [Candidatus Gastranaerophilus sp. (ex Termes propinquus)]
FESHLLLFSKAVHSAAFYEINKHV